MTSKEHFKFDSGGRLSPGQGYDIFEENEMQSDWSSSSDDHEPPSEQNERPASTGKISSLGTTKYKPQRKHLPGRQGYSKGLVQMPIEIFAEIACLLTPVDLISLSRVNKFLHNLLLQRSAANMWRRAESNVPGLPPCPPGLCEPQYAALIFMKYCTSCGTSSTAKPDTELLVRLCPPCRETKLRDIMYEHGYSKVDMTLFHCATSARSRANNLQSRGSNLGLRREVNGVLRKQQELRRAGDKQALIKWENDRRLIVLKRRKFAQKLQLYLKSVDVSRGKELNVMKQNRKEAIIQRLGALGWTEKDMDFLGYEEEKAWLALVEVAKPLTERIWSNLLPKLTSLLEENRRQNIAEHKKRLSYERSACFGEFFSRLRFKIHQFEPILEALGMGEPCRPNPDGPGALSIGASWKKTVARMDIVSLFPKTRTMLAWDCLSGLDEPDMTAQEVYKNLAERRPQVEQRLSEWRASVEEHLVEIFESGGNGTETNAILTVKGSTDSTQGLGRNSRLLLRADTIFKRDRLDPKRSIPCHYPDFVSPCSDSDRDPYTRFYYSTPGEIDLNLFSRDTGMEKIVKVLLKDLGMPDVAYLELRLMERSFVCGRCKDGRPRKWDDLVAHYIQELEDGGFSESTPRHSGMVLNVHNLDLANNSEPLVLILEQEETGSSTEATNTPSDGDGELYCYICNGAGESEYRADREDMLAHLQDVHEVTHFVEGFYYGTSPYQCLEWDGEWDDFRDACEIKAAAILALES